VLMAGSPAARAARWPLGFAALVLAYWSFDYSVASNMRRANPEAAYRARPTDPGAVAAAMNDRMVVRNQFEAGADDAANARAGLRQDPLNRVLLRTLGVHEEISRRQPEALKAMQMASRVSRRDSITELWLAEYHRRNAAPARALVHYDAAMLVRPKLQYPLLAELVKQIPDRRFRKAVQPYIRREASWTVSFVGTAAAENLDDVVALVDPVLGSLANGRNNTAIARIAYRLAARGDLSESMSIAERGIRGFDSRKFALFDFNKANTDSRLGALAWSMPQDERVSSSIEGNETLVISASPLSSGIAAVRDIPVQPNSSYVLGYKLANVTPSAVAELKWSAQCIDSATAFPVPEAASAMQSSGSAPAYAFTTGAGCHLLRLTARVTGADSTMPAQLAISDLRWRLGKGGPT